MRRFDSTDFDTKRGHFAADASDLGFPPGTPARQFEIETIGQIAVFTLVGSQPDINGDVMHWFYESNHLPGRVGKMTAVIFND